MKQKIILLLFIGVSLLVCSCNQKRQDYFLEKSLKKTKNHLAVKKSNRNTDSELIEKECPETASQEALTEQPDDAVSTESMSDVSLNSKQSTGENSESITEKNILEELAAIKQPLDDTSYIGEYTDADVKEPNLEIAKGNGDSYIVQIGIYRLTTLNDGIGKLTAKGMNFTATDAAGNPISGIITIWNQTAIVTFTDSTWAYLTNGSSFQYTKISNTPNIQNDI